MAYNPYEVLKPVQSSMFSRVGYSDTMWTLLFEFKTTGEIREYRNVAPEVADEALSAQSIGRYFNANVKGNPGWEYETLGADPAMMLPKAPKPQPQTVEMNVMDEDIRLCEPGWNGTTIESMVSLHGYPAHLPLGAFDTHAQTYGGIDRSQTMIEPNKTPDWKPQIHVAENGESFQTVEFKADYPEDDGHAFQTKEMVVQPQGEVLGAWQTPTTPVEAVALLNEHASEINAIIAQSAEANANALKVKVVDVSTHAVAGDVLTRLVQRKDSAFKLLDPFRAILHTAYKFAGSRAAAAIDPLDTAITYVKRQMGTWEQEEERKRLARIQEERRRAEEAARELQRQQQEAITLAEVTDALEQGDTAKAEDLVANPIQVPLPYVAPQFIEPTYLPPAGQSTRANWKIREETIDMVAFLRAVKDGKLTIEVAARYILPNLPALNKQAKSLEGTFNGMVPGFEAFNDPVRSVRRGK